MTYLFENVVYRPVAFKRAQFAHLCSNPIVYTMLLSLISELLNALFYTLHYGDVQPNVISIKFLLVIAMLI